MISLLNKTARAACFAACAWVTFGCPSDKEQITASGTSEVAESEGASLTSITSSGPTGGGSTGTATGGGVSDGMTTTHLTSTATTNTTTGDPSGTSGGGVPSDVDAACMIACEKLFECVDPPPFPDLDTCKINCAEGVTGDACVSASVTFNTCLGTLTCPQVIDALMNNMLGPCTDALAELMSACQGCVGTASVGPDGCSIGQECPNMPPVEYVCEGDTCTCLVDNMSTGVTCPAMGVCEQGEAALTMAANACCGFGL